MGWLVCELDRHSQECPLNPKFLISLWDSCHRSGGKDFRLDQMCWSERWSLWSSLILGFGDIGMWVSERIREKACLYVWQTSIWVTLRQQTHLLGFFAGLVLRLGHGLAPGRKLAIAFLPASQNGKKRGTECLLLIRKSLGGLRELWGICTLLHVMWRLIGETRLALMCLGG